MNLGLNGNPQSAKDSLKLTAKAHEHRPSATASAFSPSKLAVDTHNFRKKHMAGSKVTCGLSLLEYARIILPLCKQVHRTVFQANSSHFASSHFASFHLCFVILLPFDRPSRFPHFASCSKFGIFVFTWSGSRLRLNIPCGWRRCKSSRHARISEHLLLIWESNKCLSEHKLPIISGILQRFENPPPPPKKIRRAMNPMYYYKWNPSKLTYICCIGSHLTIPVSYSAKGPWNYSLNFKLYFSFWTYVTPNSFKVGTWAESGIGIYLLLPPKTYLPKP